MNPVVRYLILCDDVHNDPARPTCAHLECVLSNIVALDDPPFPLLRDRICVYVVLADCRGRGTAQVRVAYTDAEPEQPLFGTPEHALDFTGHSPLDALGLVFRLDACPFPQAGTYAAQFWYNGARLAETLFRVRAR
jgi:hypothetical protein